MTDRRPGAPGAPVPPVNDRLAVIFGPRRRFRPAPPESWRAIEGSVGVTLPTDYKEFVDGYGDATVFGHLGIPHPGTENGLADFIETFGPAFLGWQDPWGRTPPDPELARMIPWALHNGNGDICLLDPPVGESGWSVVVAYRHFPELSVYPGTVTDFLELLHEGRDLPREWPQLPAAWQSEESSLI
ncbi:SMI1/KNR4 family protein [Streptomyces sp. NPDC101118]|uniref:SMI1/KNR4 family protein n=1 Tax=Streptomyces sp. NPDC101118 TaxID=3366109 RepID=UPI00380218BD